MIRLAALVGVVLTLCACGDKTDPGGRERDETRTETTRPPPQPGQKEGAPPPPRRLAQLQDIAAYIAEDPTLGVFVATNRTPKDLAKKIFTDKPRRQLTYGLAYQQVSATPTGVAPKHNLSLELAKPDEFFGYIKSRSTEATRYPKHIVVFVHGFNQTPQQAMSTAVAVKSLLQFDGPFVLFMWPSIGAVRNYGTDRLNAEVSDRAFSQLLCRLGGLDPDAKVTILAHSMGNYLTANTLQRFSTDCPNARKLNALVMLSPDLPISVLEDRGEEVLSRVGSATAYVSEYDLAVRSSEEVWDVDNFGLVHNRMPTVYPGISSINVSSLQLGPFDLKSLSHDSYAYTQVMDDVFDLLSTGRTDPRQRSTRIRLFTRPDNKLAYYVMDGTAKGF